MQQAVHALSDNELLQVIIGSGAAQFPVRYIARRVQSVLKEGIPSIQTLRQVNGVGEALATRLVAVFEMASRLSRITSEQHSSVSFPYIEVEYFDFSNRQLTIFRFDRNEPNSLLTRNICKQALLTAASRLSVGLYYSQAPSLSALDDLCFIRELHTAAELFGVSVNSVHRQWGTYRKELL